MLSIIVPAHNERNFIGPCLDGLLAQTLVPEATDGVEVIVVANACSDNTVEIAAGYAPAFAGKGWELVVLDIAEGGKTNAINAAETVARGDRRVFMDADVICSPELIAALADAVESEAPRYSSGRIVIAETDSWVTRHFGRLWLKVPYMQTNVPGTGISAINAAGRARWDVLPKIIADDAFIRLHFTPQERVLATPTFTTPLADGFSALVRVRRRQDVGTQEMAETYPELVANESKPETTPLTMVKLFLGQPVSFVVYIAVMLAVRYGPREANAGWSRSR